MRDSGLSRGPVINVKSRFRTNKSRAHSCVPFLRQRKMWILFPNEPVPRKYSFCLTDGAEETPNLFELPTCMSYRGVASPVKVSAGFLRSLWIVLAHHMYFAKITAGFGLGSFLLRYTCALIFSMPLNICYASQCLPRFRDRVVFQGLTVASPFHSHLPCCDASRPLR